MDETCDSPKARVCLFTAEHVKPTELAFDFIKIINKTYIFSFVLLSIIVPLI